MPAPEIEHRPVVAGDTGLFGIRTMPRSDDASLCLMILNAGMLPSMGPFRMNVELAEMMADAQIATMRIDQSGKGESAAREGLTPTDAALMDYDDALRSLSQTGVTRTILMGICSGAVDALRIADQRESVAGLVLIDGYVERSARWHLHRAIAGIKWVKAAGLSETFGRLFSSVRPASGGAANSLGDDLQQWRSMDLHACYGRVLKRDVKTCSIFSGDFWPYNHHGQLRRFLSSFDLRNFKEVFLTDADHTYTLTRHRRRLLSTIVEWVDNEFSQDPED
jgi:pimeloyl-ACP methyl ester carboxylesterase